MSVKAFQQFKFHLGNIKYLKICPIGKFRFAKVRHNKMPTLMIVKFGTCSKFTCILLSARFTLVNVW